MKGGFLKKEVGKKNRGEPKNGGAKDEKKRGGAKGEGRKEKSSRRK